MIAVAAAALLSFGVAADGLGTDPPEVGQTPEETGDEESIRDLPELWEFPACDPCEVDTRPVVASAADRLPPVVLAGLAAFAALAVGGAYLSAGGGDETLGADSSGDEQSVDITPRGPPVESPVEPPAPPPSNEVYRAWRDLAERVGPDQARTPAEHAAAARERGLDADAVGTLTALFRRVRYGGEQPTDDLERRAREARDALERRGDGRGGTARDGPDRGPDGDAGGDR